MVPKKGLEPPHPCEYVDLNHARCQFRHFGTGHKSSLFRQIGSNFESRKSAMAVLWSLIRKRTVANSKVSLVRRVKTDAGWRYYPVAYGANGKLKPGVVIAEGEEVKYPAGHYALRYYQGARLIFEALKGASPAEAEAKRIVKASRMSAMIVAREAGIASSCPILSSTRPSLLSWFNSWPTPRTGALLRPSKLIGWRATSS